VTGEVYAHDRFRVSPGTSGKFLEMVRDEAITAHEAFGWELAGAWETLTVDDSECFVLWAIPSWERWAECEKARQTDPKLARWKNRLTESEASGRRVLLVDSLLCPFRTHRQPAQSDQTDWHE
jgi:hypothetical protein